MVITQEARYVFLKYLMLYISYVLKTSVGPAQWGKCLPEFEPKNIHKMGQVWRCTLVIPVLGLAGWVV